MITITDLTVRSFDLDHLDMVWRIADTYEEELDYTFYVERAGAPSGPWETVSSGLKQQYLFRDGAVNQRKHNTTYYYRIKAVHNVSGEFTYSQPGHQGAKMPREAAVMIYNENILFTKFTGMLCWLFPKKTFGQKCQVCYDPILGRENISNCLTCFGSGYVGGYHRPVRLHVQIFPMAQQVQSDTFGNSEQQNTSAMCIAFPPVSPEDVLVESDNTRWRVVRVETSERLRFTVRQTLSLAKIPIGDVEYSLPIEEENVLNLAVADPYNYSIRSSIGQDDANHS